MSLPPAPLSVRLDVSKDGHEHAMAILTFRNEASKPYVLLSWLTFANGTVDSNRFVVTLDGKEAAYRGIAMKRKPPVAADYLTLDPGKTISTTVDLSRAYDLSAGGALQVRYDTVNQSPDGSRLEALVSNTVQLTLAPSAK